MKAKKLFFFLTIFAWASQTNTQQLHVLKSHIDHADVTAFKSIHKKESTWHLPPQLYYAPSTETERAKRDSAVSTHSQQWYEAWNQNNKALTTYAQALRKKYVDDLEKSRTKKIDRHHAAASGMQLYVAACSVLGSGVALSILITQIIYYISWQPTAETKTTKKKWLNHMNSVSSIRFTQNLMKTLKSTKAFAPSLLIPTLLCCNNDGYSRAFVESNPFWPIIKCTLTLAASGYLAYWGITSGTHNLKIAGNYTQYLEKQIHNLDEIISFLNSQDTVTSMYPINGELL